MDQDSPIGFIGLGTMGESMCANILKAGFTVWVYDVKQEQIDKLTKLGAHPVGSLEEIAKQACYIITMVPTSKDVQAVIEGLFPHLREGTTIVEMSTISPVVSVELAQRVKAVGSVMIDAPVVKSKAAAEKGELGILVGGPMEVLDDIRPLLDCMGQEIIHLGNNGNGLVMKLCHNMLVGQIQNAVNETLLLAEEAGLDFDSVVASVRAGGGQNFYLDAKANSIKDQDYSPKFSFQNMHKDIHLATELALTLKLELPGANLVQQIYDHGISSYGVEDFSATIKTVKERAGK